MFSGFWAWFLVIVLVVAVFSADRLPDFIQSLKEKAAEGAEVVKKEGAEAMKKGKEKIAQVKEKNAQKEQEKDKED